MGQQQKRPRTVADDWPIIARGVGMFIGLTQAAAALISGPSIVSPEVLVFAGSLIVAPAIARGQEKRNGNRKEEDDQ
jgi:hypothetical protein